jgi:membrane protein implicated in regulation of membrane protease activity
MPVYLRYCLYQLPGCVVVALLLAAAVRWVGLATWLGWTLFALWVLKDVLLYPFVRESYGGSPSRLVGAEHLIGARAVCEESLSPSGYVRVRGERWHARVLDPETGPILEGSTVSVHSVQDLTLLVQTVPETTAGSD